MRSGGKTINLADMTKAFHKFVKGFKPKYHVTHDCSLGLPTKAAPSPAMVKVLLYELCHRHVTLTPQLVELFNTSVSINSTAFEHLDPKSGVAIFIGNKTETALLNFTKDLGWANYKETCDATNNIQMILFSSEHKAMGCVIRLRYGVHCLYIKGASKILTWKCTHHVVVHRDGANENGGDSIEMAPIGDFEEDNISHTITFYASQTLRTITLCYRDFGHWPPHDVQLLDNKEVTDPFPVGKADD